MSAFIEHVIINSMTIDSINTFIFLNKSGSFFIFLSKFFLLKYKNKL